MVEDNNLTTPTGHTDVSNPNVSEQLYSPDPASVNLPAVTAADAMSEDISKILKDVKLPERYSFSAQGDTKPLPNEEVLPPEEPVVAIPTKTETPKSIESTVMAIRTLRNDLQDAVRNNKMSLVKAVSLEQDKRRKGVIDTSVAKTIGRHRRTWVTIFAILLLFGLGVAAITGVYIITQQSKAPVSNSQTNQGILFAETTTGLPVDNTSPDSLKKEIVQVRDSYTGAVGSIVHIVPFVSTTTSDGTAAQIPITLGDFLKGIGANPPDDLLRSVGPDFFFGIHTVDKNAPVFVIPVTSYDHAFADMLVWETTLNTDLSPIFVPVPTLKSDASGLPVTRTFEDVVMNNYDVRALKDDSGTIQLYYSFPRPNILVIAQSPYTFTEVLSRLQSARKL